MHQSKEGSDPTATPPLAEQIEGQLAIENAIVPTSPCDSHEKPNLSLARTIALALILASSSFFNVRTLAQDGSPRNATLDTNSLAISQTSITLACVIVLPTIGRDLHIPEGRQQWLLSASSLAYACTLPFWGRLADIVGRRFIFRFGLACVSLSCLVAPFAPEEVSFDIFLALQGLGAAAATPSAVGIIFGVFPQGQSQIYAMSAFSAGFPLGNVIGNILGGIIAQSLNWRWIFWIMAIATAISYGLSLLLIPPLAKDIEIQSVPLGQRLKTLVQEMDWVGLLMSLAMLLLLLVALTEGNVVGWRTSWVLALLIISCLLLPAFIAWELRLERKALRPPLLKLSIFRSRTYCAAQAISFIFWASFNNFLVFATYFYQYYQGLGVIQTTLRFLPTGITGILTVCVASQILSRVSGYAVALWGTTCVSVACLLFAVPIPADTTSYWAYGFPAMILLTLGADTLYPCTALFVMKSIPEGDQAMGAAIFQTLSQVGRSIGLAIATAIQIAVTKNQSRGGLEEDRGALLSGYRAAYWFSFAIGVASIAIAAYSFRGAGKLGN
ncbi:Major facilitator superfamily transporter [Apiospora arundinis]|uniref:Drug resistance protein n=1 Tax=Apiospora arundinis TaxID=335852 RepID=A0ABR2HPG0_9PEZI